jgi:hypothetical protein
VRNALKVTNEHLRFEKFFRGLYPGPPLKAEVRHKAGKGGQGEGGQGKAGGEGREWCPLASI